MKVYELIQELAKYGAEEDVHFIMNEKVGGDENMEHKENHGTYYNYYLTLNAVESNSFGVDIQLYK